MKTKFNISLFSIRIFAHNDNEQKTTTVELDPVPYIELQTHVEYYLF